MAAASSSRQRGCSDDASRWRIKARKSRLNRPDRPVSSSRGDDTCKLQELKLAFCLLSREIQGLDDGGGQVPATATPSAAPSVNTGGPPAPKKPASPSQPSTERDSRLEKKKQGYPNGGNVAAVSSQDGRLRQREHSGSTERARSENRKAAEVKAKEAKHELKTLNAELDAERRSRMAAER